MKMYRCKATIEVDIAVEGASLAEAERIIDGVLRNADEVRIIEGTVDDPIDELIGSTNLRATRGRIQVET